MDKRILALGSIIAVIILIFASFNSVAGFQTNTISSTKKTSIIKDTLILERIEKLIEIKSIKELLPIVSEIKNYYQMVVKNIPSSSNECGCEITDSQEWYPLLLCASLLCLTLAILIITVFIGVLVNGTKILDKIFWDKFVPFIGGIFGIIDIFVRIFNCPTFDEQYQIIYEEVKTIATNSENLISHQQFDIIFSKLVNLIEIGRI